METKNGMKKPTYGIVEILCMGISWFYTRLFWKKARLIRLPVRIRGKAGMVYGEGFTTGYSNRIEIGGDATNKTLRIGRNCIIGDYAHIVAHHSVTIGDNVLFASRVFVSDTSHGTYDNSDVMSRPEIPPKDRPLYFAKVRIGDNVWIGENACILPGVIIGNNCIIGSNSVITKSIPDNSIVVGIPGRVIKSYNTTTRQWEAV